MPKPIKVFWWQNQATIWTRFIIPTKVQKHYTIDSTKGKLVLRNKNGKQTVTIEFFERVHCNMAETKFATDHIMIKLPKKDTDDSYWPRLTAKTSPGWIKTDTDKQAEHPNTETEAERIARMRHKQDSKNTQTSMELEHELRIASNGTTPNSLQFVSCENKDIPKQNKKLLDRQFWVKQFSKSERHEWFIDVYRMRLSDINTWGGGALRGLIGGQRVDDLDAKKMLVVKDFMIFMKLAVKNKVLPSRAIDFSIEHCIRRAAELLPYNLEKCDAITKYGEENVHNIKPSLRVTGEHVYGTGISESYRSTGFTPALTSGLWYHPKAVFNQSADWRREGHNFETLEEVENWERNRKTSHIRVMDPELQKLLRENCPGNYFNSVSIMVDNIAEECFKNKGWNKPEIINYFDDIGGIEAWAAMWQSMKMDPLPPFHYSPELTIPMAARNVFSRWYQNVPKDKQLQWFVDCYRLRIQEEFETRPKYINRGVHYYSSIMFNDPRDTDLLSLKTRNPDLSYRATLVYIERAMQMMCDLAIFVKLAKVRGVLPKKFDIPAFLGLALKRICKKYTMSMATNDWYRSRANSGNHNLRKTADEIYGYGLRYKDAPESDLVVNSVDSHIRQSLKLNVANLEKDAKVSTVYKRFSSMFSAMVELFMFKRVGYHPYMHVDIFVPGEDGYAYLEPHFKDIGGLSIWLDFGSKLHEKIERNPIEEFPIKMRDINDPKWLGYVWNPNTERQYSGPVQGL